MEPSAIIMPQSSAKIIPLVEAGGQAREVGAKAARLGALLRDGERVPDGFCVAGTGADALALASEAYRLLGLDVDVAVRSSASAEDGSEASFAGQFETVLNVRGEEALADALARCWASATGTRAESYRNRSGNADGEPLQMAVLVQRMVPARAAGVAFSANPLTGARDEVVIEAARGLGDAVVSGEITPDEFIVADGGGLRTRAGRAKEAAALTEAEARAISTLVRRIEASAGTPQDVEWALDDTGLWLLQARPITALPDAVRWESPLPGAKWIKDLQAAEWATEPLSPLGATTTFEAMAIAREQARGWPPLPKVREPGHTLINGWLYMRVDGRPLTLVANILGAMLSILTGTLNGHRRVQRTWTRHISALEGLERIDVAALSDEDLRQHADQLLGELAMWWIEVCLFRSFTRVGEQFIGQMKPLKVDEPALLFSGNDSLLLDAERTLCRVAAGDIGVDQYLARFGHFVESADPIHPTLRESPEHLAWQLEAARRNGEGPDQRLARLRSERATTTAAILSMHGPRGFFVRRLLEAGQSHAAHTDDAVFHFQRVLAMLRATFLETGRRLVAAGVLQQSDDVFYLESNELWARVAATDLQARVAERRILRERRKRLAPPPFIPVVTDAAWTNDPMFKRMPPAMRASLLERGLRERDGHRVLVGTPGSPGRARGIARVIVDTADFARFQPGDILVAHATSPIWTPLLGIAAAAVTEVGGPFSHAAIVAREFGIPLVDGALDATRVITDGTPVVVDGSAGIVEL